MIAADTEIESEDGTIGTYVVRPDGEGPFPVVLFLMDAPGKRPLLHRMADRIASNGYFVMLPNLYYRTTPSFELDFASRESFQRMVELMGAVGNRMVGRDAGALLAHAATDPAADTGRVGCVGYCMSGPFSVWVAAEFPDQVKAAASFYGVRLHVDATDSPHRRLGEISGELYIAAAEHDDYVPLDMIDRFEAAMQASGVRGRVERYWGTHHGFAFDDRPAYDRAADERHWTALLDLFERNLGR
jgi:carboxymethylenebutenolidase